MMEKKTWVRPQAEIQKFVANEYVAACGDTEYGSYKFVCDAGAGTTARVESLMFGCYYEEKYVWKVTRDDTGADLTRYGYYGACGTLHEASKGDEFILGHMDNVYTSVNENIPVYIWTEGGRNVHCTTNLNRDSWESAKS